MSKPLGTAANARRALREFASPQKAAGAMRFFKTRKGQYGEGDIFIGVTSPELRQVANEFKDLPDAQIKMLLRSKIHEERSLALAVWGMQSAKGDAKRRMEIAKQYEKHFAYVNNWDLVDSSAANLLGPAYGAKLIPKLRKWAGSEHLWTRRIAIVATHFFTRNGKPGPVREISKRLIRDEHDLIHKASGWMLREMGKHCGEKTLTDFLDTYAARMPRTALRYAIERLTPQQRRAYLTR